MADRYQDRPYPADDPYAHGDDPHARGDNDPLAELARLIGQSDPFAAMDRANQTAQPNPAARDSHRWADEEPAAGPPPWMQRAARQPEPPQDYPSSVHPLQRYAAQHAVPSADHHQQAPFPHYDEQTDPSRYDDALYGQLDTGAPRSRNTTPNMPPTPTAIRMAMPRAPKNKFKNAGAV